MHRQLSLVVVASCLSAASFLSQPVQSQELDPELLRKALHPGASQELRAAVREGLPLRKIEALLETEEDRKRVDLLRDALKRLRARNRAGERSKATTGPAGTIGGRLTDAGSGLPLDFEIVGLYDALGELVDIEFTDEGDYLFEDVAAGTYFVRTGTDDHLDELYDGVPCPLGACDVTTGTRTAVGDTAMLGSPKILRVSLTILSSSSW